MAETAPPPRAGPQLGPRREVPTVLERVVKGRAGQLMLAPPGRSGLDLRLCEASQCSPLMMTAVRRAKARQPVEAAAFVVLVQRRTPSSCLHWDRLAPGCSEHS